MKIFTTAFTADRKGWPISLVWWAVLVCSVFWTTLACAGPGCTYAQELNNILGANERKHSLSFKQALIPVYEFSLAENPGAPYIGSQVRNSVAAADVNLMNEDGRFYSFTIQVLPKINGVHTARISLWPTSEGLNTSPIWINRLGGHFQLAKVILRNEPAARNPLGSEWVGGGVRFSDEGEISNIQFKSGLNGVDGVGDKILPAESQSIVKYIINRFVAKIP
jgi:hypothetical protein